MADYYDESGQYYDNQANVAGSYGAGMDASTAGGDQYTDSLPEVLYLMQYCAQAFAPTNDSDEARIAANDSWNPVREWLATSEPNQIRDAAEQRDDVGKTALHFACQHVPPMDIIETFLVTAPDIIQWPDSFGWLPIHYACAYGAGSGVIKALAEAFPESKTTVDRKGRTPLHFFLGVQKESLNKSVDNDADVVVLLSNTGAASYPTDEGLLPLHLACAYGRTEEILYVLLDAYPEAATTIDNKQRTPLLFVLSNGGKKAAPAAVRLLLSQEPELVNSIGGGPLPLLVLALHGSKNINRKDVEQMDAVQGCLKHILSARPKPTPEYFSALQRLPSFLQERAVVMKVVQELLNEKISERFPTAILMADAFMQFFILVGYMYGVLESIDRRWDDTKINSFIEQPTPYRDGADVVTSVYVWLAFMYVGIFYFLVREFAQAISLGALGAFQVYVRDLSNWLNFLYISLVAVWATLMMLGTGDRETFRICTSVSVFFIIIKLLAYLRTVYIDFAIFSGGVFHVLNRLVGFMVCLLIFIVAFSRVLYTLYLETDTCILAMRDQPVYERSMNETLRFERLNAIQCGTYETVAWCYHWESIMSVYTMLLGEIDENNFKDGDEFNVFAIIVFVVFFFFVVILLANVLIAIVTDSYKIIQDERAAIVFWTNRLNFIVPMDALANGPIWKLLRQIFGLGTKKKKEEESRRIRFGENVWKKIMDLWYEDEVEGGIFSLEFYCYAAAKLATIIIVPAWFLLGFSTFGILWPPQLRGKMFTSKISKLTVADKEDMQRKNQIQSLHTEIENLRDELLKDLTVDRTQVLQLKSSVAEKKLEIQNEMKHIKRVVTMLFEQQSGM
jgi:hypothetical protein